MKKLLLVPAFMLAFFFSTISSVSAADVWVNHINDLDIYVVEETLSGNSDNFSVVVFIYLASKGLSNFVMVSIEMIESIKF